MKTDIKPVKLCVLILFFLFFISCSEDFPSDERFIVTRSESYGRKTKYLIEGIKGISSFYIKTETLYRVGDTLHLIK